MTPQRYELVRTVFLAARARPADERATFVRDRCAGDAALAAEVEALLASDAAADTFLSRPALGTGFALDGPAALAGRTAAAALPERLGGFRIVGVLGEGGMGVVYRAEQDEPRRTVALKVIRPGAESREALRRFAHEGQVLAWLHHPGIAQIYEAGTAETEAGPRPYFAMELVEGRPLGEYADAAGLDARARVELVARVCDAVHHAHQRGVIHRDLKPGNIVVGADGQPRILDFGVARVTEPDLRLTAHTEVGRLIGTLAYMSPEQLAGDPREVDTRADVYALGVLAYELLAGRPPLDVASRSLPEAARVIAEVEPPPLGAARAALRGDLETIVGKALEKDKNRRYASASDLAADLRRYLTDQPIAARPATTWYQLSKFARRNRALVGGAAAVVVALVGGVIGTSYGLVQARAERNRALEAERLAEARLVEVEREADKVRTVSEFLQGMLAAADPGRDGREVRVVDVLRRAAEDVGRRLADQPEIAASLRNTIGMTYVGLGLYADAEPHLAAAHDTRAQALGPRHADTLAAATNLALARLRLGRADEGTALLRAVLAAREATLGADHPQTLDAMNNLASALQGQGAVDEAAALWQAALAAQRRVLAPDDPKRAIVLNNLAQLLKQLRRPAEAEPLLREALELQTAALGEEHPHTLAAVNNLAMVLKALERQDEATALLERVVAVRRRTLGEHPALYAALSNLARAQEEQGALAAAETHAREALAGLERLLGADAETVWIAQSNLAMLLVTAGRADEAEPLITAALERARAARSAGHFLVMVLQRNRGQCLAALGRLEEAEPLLLASHAGLERALGPQHEHTHKAAQALAALYTAWGRAEEAAVWRERSAP